MLDRAHAATGVAWVAKDGRRFADVDAAPAAAAAAPRDSFTISLWANPDIDLRLMPAEPIKGRLNATGKNFLVSSRPGRDMPGDGTAGAGPAPGRTGPFRTHERKSGGEGKRVSGGGGP